MPSTTLTFPVTDQQGDAALRRAVAVLSTGGYTVQTSSDTEAIGVKRVIPGWAIALAVVFGLFCLVGLIFLLVKEEREVRVSLVPGPGGGSIVVSGAMNAKLVDRLRVELAGPPVATPSALASSTAEATVFAAGIADAPVVAAEPAVVVPEAEPDVTAPPPGAAPTTAWSGPPVVAPAEPAAAAPDTPISPAPGSSESVAEDPSALADVDGYTIARPRRSQEPAQPTVQLDDGQVLPIVGLVLVGRDPAPAPGEEVGRLVALTDDTRGLSKTHAGFTLVGGQLVVVDRHSTNGTVVRSTAGTERRCAPGEPTPVGLGDTIELGGRRVVRIS